MKPSRILAPAALAAGAALVLTGCSPVDLRTGGPRATDDREIDAVESVLLRTSGDLEVLVGDTPSLTISAPRNVLDRLTSEVVDGVLVLGRRGFGPSPLGEVRYTLTVPRITDVAIDGSGDVEADFTGADEVRVEISGSGDVSGDRIDAVSVITVIDGSGDVELEGTADESVVELSGSGDVEFDDLVARTARVVIDGSGDVEVRATDSLDIDLSGSGQVRHSGGARVTSDVSGSGSVRAA